MTSANLRSLLSSLPDRVLGKIQKLAKETGESVETIIERALDLYAKKAKPRFTAGDDELAKLMSVSKNRAIFDRITAAMGRRSIDATTPEQRTARGIAGGSARAATLTAERRKEIAIAASQAAKAKRDAKRKLAEADGSKSKPVV